MRSALVPVSLAAGMAYPFWVYAVQGRVEPAWIMLPLSALWLLRTLLARPEEPGGRLLPAAALAGCIALSCSDAQLSLRAYPVLVSLFMLAIFGGSLRYGPPVIERLARLREPELPEQGVRYTRRVTQVWCVFFLLNAGVAAALALWAPWSWWTLYTGGISYALIGALLVGERALRPFLLRAA
ncbi:hypothetical protein PIGHUM_03452 [Pigmentiphaga humi]|uniref:Intracellular septation protein A n=1 Tax=Pigmentiphaga humi TaxID=2478468 RepID=A0A3P4B4Y8_9BURK|nr:hypothetical protein [Pigmentiphaga humi]VCU71369.1 hypothetical protein PIGHUM_03452 [Pigmentiphaga humi]